MSDKTVTVVETTNSAVINATTIEVVSVGTQGPAGPTQIGTKNLPTTIPTDGVFVQYDESSGAWIYTSEIDAGTY